MRNTNNNEFIDHASFQAIVSQSPISTQIFSPDGLTIMVNKAWEELWQTKPKDIVNRYNILEDKQLIEKKIMPFIKKAFQGEIVAIPSVRYEPEITIPGIAKVQYKVVKAVMYPIKDSQGDIVRVVLQHEDVTLEHSILERQEFLVKVSDVLGSSIEYKKTIQNIGRLIIPYLADYCRIVVVDDEKHIEEITVNHVNPSKIPLVKTLYDAYKKDTANSAGVGKLLATGKAEYISVITPEILKRTKPKVKKLVKQLRLQSYIGVPMKIGGRVIGALTFSSASKQRLYSKEDLQFAEEIARRIAYAIENARLYQEVATREKKFRSSIEHSYDGIVFIIPSGKATYVSNSMQHVLGYTSEEYQTLNGADLVHPDDLKKEIQFFRKILKHPGNTFAPHQTRFKHKNGTYKWIEYIATNLIKDPAIHAIVFNFRDITERKQSEEELVHRASLVNSSSDAIWSRSFDGEILSWNKGAENLYGFQAEEIIGKSSKIIVPLNKRKELNDVFTQVIEGKSANLEETELMTKKRQRVTVSVSFSPIREADGSIFAIAVIARDISERKRMENNLRFLSDASRILSSSLDYRVTLQNVAKLAVPHIADWASVSMKTDKGIEQLAIVHIDSRKVKWAKELNRRDPPDPNAKTGIPNILRTGVSEFYPDITDEMLVKVAKNKEQLDLLRKLHFTSAMTVPMRIGKDVIGAISFVSAESGRHYSKADLAIAESVGLRAGIAIQNAQFYTDAKKAITLRDDFISVASHELKTPLTSLKMYSQSLLRQFEKQGNRTFTSFIEKIDKQTDKLTLLVNDLLNVSKIRHGQLEFTMETIDLNQIVKDTVEAVQETTSTHAIVIEGKIKKKVYADQYRIYQVLTNLLTNAIKYSPTADKVIVSLIPEKDLAVVTVQDFGIGIEPDQQKKIFSQFYRVENPEEKTFPGLGMGLFISNEIIKRHGGTMSVVSSKGKGSQFSFTMPYTVKI